MQTSTNKPTFTMLVGLPGSGKSTYAAEQHEKYGVHVCSSDAIRKELAGDENSQENNEDVFKLLHKRVKEYLKNGESVIYDATNVKSKRRRAFLKELKYIVKKFVLSLELHMTFVLQIKPIVTEKFQKKLLEECT